MTGIRFSKGHGTENDFVLLPDAAGELALTAGQVRALCDRRSGIGGDGVLRVVRCAASPDAPSDVDGWFMDYRNADGSLAEMCGNGARVFARYLVDTGLEPNREFEVYTRGGWRRVQVHQDGSVTVHMGQVTVGGTSSARLGGVDYPGLAVDVGNPHLVCLTETPVGGLSLDHAPEFDPAVFPAGVNVEFANRVVDDPGKLRMRVFERGSGETRSCGTGVVATVAAALHAAGRDRGAATVDVPGGTVNASVEPGGSTLTGPAVLVGHGELDPHWWATR